MDFITTFIAGLNEPTLTWVSLLFQDTVFALLIATLAFLLMVRLKTSHASPLFVALLLSYLLLEPLKGSSAFPRPCVELPAKIPCPSDFSFPSGHSTVSGIFILSAAGTPLFLPFLALGLFTSFSRIYLGIHAFSDIAAGLAIGMILYALSERVFSHYRRAVK